jgi:hypothetical protein
MSGLRAVRRCEFNKQGGAAFGGGHSWRAFAAGVSVALGLPMVITPAHADTRPASREASEPAVYHPGLPLGRAEREETVAFRNSRLLRVASGETLTLFDLTEPAGVVRLLRVTVPHGTRATLTGVIPRVAAVGISTPGTAVGSETCERRSAIEACAQAEEACPMPAATWRFRLRKLAGPAGVVAIEFVISQARAT